MVLVQTDFSDNYLAFNTLFKVGEKSGNKQMAAGVEIFLLNSLGYYKTACPGPLEVIAAQPAGNIHAFAAVIQTGYFFYLEGF